MSKSITFDDIKGLSTHLSNNKHYQSGEYIYRQGEDSKFLFVIKTGSAKSLISSVEGVDQVIGFHFTTEVLGLDSLNYKKYVSSLIAQENSIVCAFPRQLIEKLCEITPGFQRDLIARLSREISHEHQLFMLINKNTAEQRVAIFLLDLFIRIGYRGRGGEKAEINLCMSRADISNYLGLVPETISRVLSKFEQQGMIIVKKKKLTIVNLKMLSEFSSHHCHSELA